MYKKALLLPPESPALSSLAPREHTVRIFYEKEGEEPRDEPAIMAQRYFMFSEASIIDWAVMKHYSILIYCALTYQTLHLKLCRQMQ